MAHRFLRAAFLSTLLLATLLAGCNKKNDPASPPAPPAAAGNAEAKAAALSAADCKSGFEWKDGRCLDIDECGFVADVCGTPLAKCANKPGGYECTCPRGYAGGGPLGIACTPRVITGRTASCALPESGGVMCWGAKDGGVLHRDNPEDFSPVPAAIPLAEGAVALALGSTHACILRVDATVACWGRNKLGQLGDGSPSGRPRPFQVPGLSDVVRVEAGASHTCAVLRDGALRCWGANYSEQMAHSNTPPSESDPTPRAIEVGRVVSVALGVGHSCALRSDGTVTCWGSNEEGQLGTGTQEAPSQFRRPTDVVALRNVRALSENAALLVNGGVMFWGEDQVNMKEVLEELKGVELRGPTVIPELIDVTAIAGRPYKTCALLKSGSVWCRGVGPLGDGKDRSSSTPVMALGLTQVLALASAGDCALDAQQGVLCWGWNEFQRLGGAKGLKLLRPTPVAGLKVLNQ